jgi:hypothetical protein
MGARINFVFKDGTDSSVVLYSHWGQSSWKEDIAEALVHARPRWSDSSYGTRMIISYLLQHNIHDETGFGLYAVHGDNFDLGEQTVVVDFVNKTIIDDVAVDWEAFINAYAPQPNLASDVFQTAFKDVNR